MKKYILVIIMLITLYFGYSNKKENEVVINQEEKISNVDSLMVNISLVLVTLLVSSFISSITVGGKAIGKRYAIKNADKIIFVVAKVLNRFKFKK